MLFYPWLERKMMRRRISALSCFLAFWTGKDSATLGPTPSVLTDVARFEFGRDGAPGRWPNWTRVGSFTGQAGHRGKKQQRDIATTRSRLDRPGGRATSRGGGHTALLYRGGGPAPWIGEALVGIPG